MAVTKSNINVNPTTGSGNTTLTFTADPASLGNRVAKNATFTVTAPGVSPNKTITATLEAAAEFVSFDDGVEMAVVKGGGAVVITGTSNSNKLTFTKGSGSVVTADIASIKYKVNTSTDATNGVAITGDPGAAAKYTFELTLTAVANTTINERTQQITVTTTSNKTATIQLKQAAGDAYLNLSASTITVPQTGSATIDVTTNTTFTVS
jgi:hypothetical protein